MNAGFTSLEVLKKHLLASALRNGLAYDEAMLALGLGVARMFDVFCNRKLTWSAADTCELSADRDSFILPRYPVVSVSKVELKESEADGWLEQADVVRVMSAGSGLVYFGFEPGSHWCRVRLTFAGGFWFQPLDSTEAGFPQAQPAGAALLPDDLVQVWLLQCRKVWESVDKTGVGITKVGSGATFVTESLGGLDLVPMVRSVLERYRRFQLI
jgi:hypothetical protein